MEGCMCSLCKEYISKENVIYESHFWFVMFNRFPYLPGHIMLVPKRPIPNLEDITVEERVEMINELIDAQTLLINALQNKFGVTSSNIGINLGPNSGASIPTHLHIHLVPRRPNDSNFMHTCTFSGFGERHDPIMYDKMYSNARMWIIEEASKRKIKEKL